MSDIAIKVENLGKLYHIGAAQQRHDTLRDALIARFRRSDRSKHNESIWALRNTSFEIKQGEVVGIIGRNGTGKSTLLKILSRITEPTKGHVEIHGRVGSLLEVGTGFHPELTGRENIYLNGAILGMKREEIDQKFDEIVSFSEISKFLDTPVKRYSSGMWVRLGFGVAAHLDPEILLVDEVLAVGDAGFQKKCLGKMEEVGKVGRTVLFVSHNMGMINSLCERAVLLREGTVAADGETSLVVTNYLRTFDATQAEQEGECSFPTNAQLPFQINAVRLMDESGQTRSRFDLFEPITVELDYVIREAIEGSHLAVVILHQGEWILPTWDTDTVPERFHQRKAGYFRARLRLPSPLLKAGRYHVSVGMGIANVRGVHNPDTHLAFDVVEESLGTSLVAFGEKRPGRLAIPIDWEVSELSGTLAK